MRTQSASCGRVPARRREAVTVTGRQDYAEVVVAICSHADDLGGFLATWSARDDKPDARVRRAASEAVTAIDAALRVLHGVRARLVGEIRDSDDASAARADALLERLRGDQR
jgi:hypothetical protein